MWCWAYEAQLGPVANSIKGKLEGMRGRWRLLLILLLILLEKLSRCLADVNSAVRTVRGAPDLTVLRMAVVLFGELASWLQCRAPRLLVQSFITGLGAF